MFNEMEIKQTINTHTHTYKYNSLTLHREPDIKDVLVALCPPWTDA